MATSIMMRRIARLILGLSTFVFLLASHVSSVSAQSVSQLADVHFVIPSPQIPELELSTHTVDMRLDIDQNLISVTSNGNAVEQLQSDQLILTVQSSYRFHNTSRDDRTVRLVISPIQTFETSLPSSAPESNAILQNLALQIDGQPTGLQNGSNGGFMFDLALSADQTRTILLTYSFPVGSASLPTTVYPVGWLNDWSNDFSLRVNLAQTEDIPIESWTIIEPDSWNYALSANIQQPDIKWLYDVEIPESDILLQFIHPLVWRDLQNARSTAKAEPNSVNFLEVGSQYSQLYLAATSLPLSEQGVTATAAESVAELFYAQAIAAYTQGLQSASGTTSSPTATALLHARLAGLYRNRIIMAGSANQRYAELTVNEADAALRLLPAESTLKAELVQWQSEGLYSLLQFAQQQQDWEQGLRYIDQLTSLNIDGSNPVYNAQRLSDIRQLLVVQQALDLIETGNKDAAISLAGPDITSAELLPPIDEQSIFAQWQITATIQSDRTYLNIRAVTDNQQLQRGQNGIAGLIGNWQRAGWVTVEQETSITNLATTASGYGKRSNLSAGVNESPNPLVRYAISASLSLENGQPRDVLIQSLPDDANWALIRSLLQYLTPQADGTRSLLMEEQQLEMTLDLRAAGDHWSTMVAKLQRDAQQALGESGQGESNHSLPNQEAAKAALKARIRSVNFANEAKMWQDLAEKSWVMVTMSSDSSVNPVKRSWIATVQTPPQRFRIENSTLATGRISILFVALFIAVFIFSGILWWLL